MVLVNVTRTYATTDTANVIPMCKSSYVRLHIKTPDLFERVVIVELGKMHATRKESLLRKQL
jgi:hypothetical protein